MQTGKLRNEKSQKLKSFFFNSQWKPAHKWIGSFEQTSNIPGWYYQPCKITVNEKNHLISD